MGFSSKAPAPPNMPPPPPTAAVMSPPRMPTSARLGGTFLTASMPNAPPITKPKPSLFGN